MKMNNHERNQLDAISPMYGEFYLNRHWENRIPISNFSSIPTKRLLTYYRKYISLRLRYNNYNEDYGWKENDEQYNAEFGCSPSIAVNYYLDQVKCELDKRENSN
jgi:hypothetical protein